MTSIIMEQGAVGGVERKLLTFPRVKGIVFGTWGETSQATHQLVEELASSRALRHNEGEAKFLLR